MKKKTLVTGDGAYLLFRIGGFPSIFYFFDPGKLSGKLIPPTSFSIVFVYLRRLLIQMVYSITNYLRPENWGTDPIWRAYFSLMIWWVETQPPTSQVIVYFRIFEYCWILFEFLHPQSLRVRPWTWMVGSVGRRSRLPFGGFTVAFQGQTFKLQGCKHFWESKIWSE